MRLFAVEERRDHFDELVRNLERFDAEHGGTEPVAYLRRGTLAVHLDEAFRLIGQSPAFVFLDPFGADGLSLDVVRRTLALPKGEVFALFSPRAVYRHLCVLAVDDHVDRVRRQASEQPGIFPDLDAAWLTDELERAEQSDASLLPTREAAERILARLFGSEAEVQRILALPKATWPDEVLKAYLEAMRASGATHVTPIAIFDAEQHQAYYLIHAAKNRKATIKMKEAVHSAVSKSPLPKSSKERIRLAHAVPMSRIVELVLEQFAGQDVRWTDDAKSQDTVQGYALAETPMMNDQAPDLREELTRAYLLEKKPLRLRFPPTGGR